MYYFININKVKSLKNATIDKKNTFVNWMYKSKFFCSFHNESVPHCSTNFCSQMQFASYYSNTLLKIYTNKALKPQPNHEDAFLDNLTKKFDKYSLLVNYLKL